jgi:hypothetical protein
VACDFKGVTALPKRRRFSNGARGFKRAAQVTAVDGMGSCAGVRPRVRLAPSPRFIKVDVEVALDAVLPRFQRFHRVE